MMIKNIVFFLFLMAISLQDIKTKKASNLLTLPMIVIGLLIGSRESLGPTLVGLLLWFFIYGFGVLGGADIKAVMAINTWYGFLPSIYCFLFAQIIMLIYFSIKKKGFIKKSFKNLSKNLNEIKTGKTKKTGQKHPFLPFLTLGSTLYLVVTQYGLL